MKRDWKIKLGVEMGDLVEDFMKMRRGRDDEQELWCRFTKDRHWVVNRTPPSCRHLGQVNNKRVPV